MKIDTVENNQPPRKKSKIGLYFQTRFRCKSPTPRLLVSGGPIIAGGGGGRGARYRFSLGGSTLSA